MLCRSPCRFPQNHLQQGKVVVTFFFEFEEMGHSAHGIMRHHAASRSTDRRSLSEAVTLP